jgi:hypothetical protein
MRISMNLFALALCSAAPQPLFQATAVTPAPIHPALLAMASPEQSGQVVITEFLKDPAFVTDAKGEWIEIWNALPSRVNLDGWTISDDAGSSHTLNANGTTQLIMKPGERWVLAINGDPTQNGGVQPRYVYSGFTLANGADQIILRKPDGTLVDRVEYDDGVLYPDTPGRSIQLHRDYSTVYYNDDPGEWCHSQSPWNSFNTDTGSPGAANQPCW